ncbi:diaminopimelate dehydrogenase [Eggerthellaceae bacterium zg-1084]|uniref:diaminopimelate dehydrogenase n=1 Tax=Berryella wangjianweii TaxID=2734634 RepID=UPI0015566004|nr:diaminopimelate dehydrogenase [Berryella wangjianweii]NPD31302.1 diaminopimelate dehydrogenase [Berryella wangjianweii]NPD32389.1 diaminopimelate dehydrogenase [Eggerthellaceae bacterium zg-997]
MSRTRIGILGYGNLGKGVELALRQSDDMELAAVFTRRDPADVSIATPGVPVRREAELEQGAGDDIDVLILCGGSATDLPTQTPKWAARCNVVDSFDTHAAIPRHFAAVDAAAKEAGTVALISCGWDPGLFSLNRLYATCILPEGTDYTFWGKGVSQGHSDAIRRIEGVADARQYTIPAPEALDRARAGENPQLTTRQMHTRECWVVLEEGADADVVRRQIVEMPNYFEPYDTTVNFITQQELDRDHADLPHGGFVLRSGATASGKGHVIEYALKLESNPEFTASVLVAYARAVARMAAEGQSGCRTVFDVAPAYLSPQSGDYLRAHML